MANTIASSQAAGYTLGFVADNTGANAFLYVKHSASANANNYAGFFKSDGSYNVGTSSYGLYANIGSGTASTTTGDLTIGRSTTSGRLVVGGIASSYLDFNVSNVTAWSLVGGPVYIGSAGTQTLTAGATNISGVLTVTANNPAIVIGTSGSYTNKALKIYSGGGAGQFTDFYTGTGAGYVVAGVTGNALLIDIDNVTDMLALDRSGNLGILGAINAASASFSSGNATIGATGEFASKWAFRMIGTTHDWQWTTGASDLSVWRYNGVQGLSLTTGGNLTAAGSVTTSSQLIFSGSVSPLISQNNNPFSIGSSYTGSGTGFVFNYQGGTPTGALFDLQVGGTSYFKVGTAAVGGGVTTSGPIVAGNGAAGTGTAAIYSGTGVPSFSAPSGSLFLRYDGGANAHLYINTSAASTSNTTWTAVTD